MCRLFLEEPQPLTQCPTPSELDGSGWISGWEEKEGGEAFDDEAGWRIVLSEVECGED